MPIKEEIRVKYNALSPKYDKLEFLIELLFIRRLRKKLLLGVKGYILETSVGTGKNLAFYPRNTEITVTDLSGGMLKIAESKAKKLGKEVKFIEADTEELPFKANSFDTVVNSLSLCTYPDPLIALKEIRRVCKPKGKIHFLEHGVSSNRIVRWIQTKYKSCHYKKFFCHLTRDPIKLIKKSNLKIIHSERSFFGIFYLIIVTPNK